MTRPVSPEQWAETFGYESVFAEQHEIVQHLGIRAPANFDARELPWTQVEELVGGATRLPTQTTVTWRKALMLALVAFVLSLARVGKSITSGLTTQPAIKLERYLV